jgi:hypothetical protein
MQQIRKLMYVWNMVQLTRIGAGDEDYVRAVKLKLTSGFECSSALARFNDYAAICAHLRVLYENVNLFPPPSFWLSPLSPSLASSFISSKGPVKRV